MKITPAVFEAYLKCPTKCWLRATGEAASGNTYAEWVQAQIAAYRETGTARLVAASPQDEVALSPDKENVKAATWRLASSLAVLAEMDSCALESELHAVERVPAAGRGKAAQFIPIRFVFTNKLGKDDKLLLALDAVALSKALKREVSLGKIIHGDDHATLKVKTSALAGEVRKRLEKIAALLANPAPPDLVLNRHCGECEFQARCRKIAIEKDDLSLLANMSAKERQKLRNKGIFTVTQLSYTFRPRRRPKKQRDKREKYHHSLKALAIREKKIHIVGSPELKIEGTPVYLDVEGLPDRDFYYLIGLCIGNGESAVQHSLWADTVEDEGKIWREFLAILETVDKPVLIHYGSYETDFLRIAALRHGQPANNSSLTTTLAASINVLSITYAQIYFPTLKNGLKDLAGFLNFHRSDDRYSGLNAIMARHLWEQEHNWTVRQSLLTYNTEDCHALRCLLHELSPLCERGNDLRCGDKVVLTDSLRHDNIHRFGRIDFLIPDFECINRAAYWDYQREKIVLRSERRGQRPANPNYHERRRKIPPNKIIEISPRTSCPECGDSPLYKTRKIAKTVYDLKFGRFGVKRWIVKYTCCGYRCNVCGARFANRSKEWPTHSVGRGLLSYVIYHLVELRVSHRALSHSLSKLFDVSIGRTSINLVKARAANLYRPACSAIEASLIRGRVLYCDETHITVEGKTVFAWVFCDSNSVVFRRTETREGSFLKEVLQEFKGVLVSDFYAAYEAIDCPQQKCLIHLIRDLNNDLFKESYNDELKALAWQFGGLLRRIVDTIDRFGLKTRYLRKHGHCVSGFFRFLSKQDYATEIAARYRDRFERNRQTLFTFLEYDGVSWNNNTAEHAIKSLAILRKAMGGSSTRAGTDDYLVLLSVRETCKYMGVDFLDFLRSGEKNIHTFAENRRGRGRRPATDDPTALSGEESAQN
ncbi:MAG: IS66 family transposase [Verrucomicrobia bacterium]|nr:IS66 family transposase [Verrucomicrobiota bacterium]